MSAEGNVFLAPCANEHARYHLDRTVLSPVDESVYGPETDRVSGGKHPIWGVSPGKSSEFSRIKPGDFILFYTGNEEYRYAARVTETEENARLAAALWKEYDIGLRDDADELWPNIVHLENVREVNLESPDLHERAGYSINYILGFQPLNDQAIRNITSEYGSVRSYLRYWESEGAPEEYEDAQSDLDELVDETPIVEDNTIKYEETYRRARSAAFRKGVKQLYEYECAFCGAKRQSPEGYFEAEAAHIYPKSENGADDYRNGLALCKLHHWGFDSGWLALDDDHEILVRERPELPGYEDFVMIRGDEIITPDDERYAPSRPFIREHRALHGFSTA